MHVHTHTHRYTHAHMCTHTHTDLDRYLDTGSGMEKAESWEDAVCIQGSESKPICLKQKIHVCSITKVMLKK